MQISYFKFISNAPFLNIWLNPSLNISCVGLQFYNTEYFFSQTFLSLILEDLRQFVPVLIFLMNWASGSQFYVVGHFTIFFVLLSNV